MATHELIDAQFDRAVEIVQSLPKTGPIQTDYEEKLQMYSLYKQATVGNVKSPRPGIWDMLGRAKWDAWAKHKDLESYEAKWLYVEALLKVLRRYSDKTVAQNLVQELESYGGDPSNLVLSRTSMQSPDSESSGSTTSHDAPLPSLPIPLPSSQTPPATHHFTRKANAGATSDEEGSDASTGSETEDDDEAGKLRTMYSSGNIPPRRPHSSHSAHRYQTPITGSFLSQTSAMGNGVPATQPLPTFETPSAFPAPSSTSTPAPAFNPPSSSLRLTTGTASVGENPYNSRAGVDPHQYRPHPHSHPLPLPGTGGVPAVRPASRIVLERAIENVQAHLAALTERLEALESGRSLHNSASSSSKGSPRHSAYPELGSGPSGLGRLPPRGSSPQHPKSWDLNDLGLWSYVLNPMSRAIALLHKLARFFASDANRSPAKVIVRRLCLDISFLVCVVMVIGAIWRRSGVRRREVKAALVVLWRAIVGTRAPRSLQDRGV